jgi:uncharacterized membrane protein (TIGR02234 family)
VRGRSELVVAVLLVLAGAFLVVVAAGREWAVLVLPGDALRGPEQVRVPGTEVAPGVRALGVVGLAGVVAVAGSRGRGRTGVGALLSLAGLAAAVEALRALGDLGTRASTTATAVAAGATGPADATAWPWLCALGSLALLAGGGLVAARGRSWSALSARYEAPGARPVEGGSAPATEGTGGTTAPAPDAASLWAALDRGEDPTGEPGARPR